MNDFFRPHLRNFVLVFFDDILVCNHTLADHLSHLTIVFEILKANTLYEKLSKCAFARPQLEYLKYIISASGMAVDPVKINYIHNWPTISSPKSLQWLLGLAGYYRKLVRNFGLIAQPLTQLLRNDNFTWMKRLL